MALTMHIAKFTHCSIFQSPKMGFRR